MPRKHSVLEGRYEEDPKDMMAYRSQWSVLSTDVTHTPELSENKSG